MKNSRTLNQPLDVVTGLGLRGSRSLRRASAVLVLLAALITGLPAGAAEAPSQDHPGVVNINEAEVAQLQLLPRVGPALAERIHAFREENGKFGSTEDLILVRGIGDKTFEMLRTFVVTEGETTLSRKLKTSDVPTADEPADNKSGDTEDDKSDD